MINFDRLIGDKENLSNQEIIDIGVFYYSFDEDDFNNPASMDLILSGKKSNEDILICKEADEQVLKDFLIATDIDYSVSFILISAILKCGQSKGIYNDQMVDEKWQQDRSAFGTMGTKTLYKILCQIRDDL